MPVPGGTADLYGFLCSIQRLLEDVSLGLIDHYLGDLLKQTGKLCFAGGVALNCVANGRLRREGPFAELFVPPAPHI